MRGTAGFWIGIAAALGCAPKPQPSPLEPTLGHSQPLPTEPTTPETAAPITPTPEPVAPEPKPEPTEQSAATESSDREAAEQAPSIAPPEKVTAEDEELCAHITRVVLSESKDSDLTGDQIDELIASCSVALAQDRRKLGKDEFRRRADCVRAAQTVDGFAACQPRKQD